MYDEDEIVDRAVILVTDIQAALSAGTRHYAEDGRQLFTVVEVLEVLKSGGMVRLEEARPS